MLLLPSCTWGEERILPRTLALRGGGELQNRDSIAPARSHGGGLCCTWQTSRAGSAFPTYPGQICPSSTAQHTPLGCLSGLLRAAPALQNEACTKWEEWTGAGAQPTSQPPVALRKCNPSFLPQKLFALVLLDFHFSTNSINSCMGLLYILFAFQPG